MWFSLPLFFLAPLYRQVKGLIIVRPNVHRFPSFILSFKRHQLQPPHLSTSHLCTPPKHTLSLHLTRTPSTHMGAVLSCVALPALGSLGSILASCFSAAACSLACRSCNCNNSIATRVGYAVSSLLSYVANNQTHIVDGVIFLSLFTDSSFFRLIRFHNSW